MRAMVNRARGNAGLGTEKTHFSLGNLEFYEGAELDQKFSHESRDVQRQQYQ
jgi:hypothetical protein